MNGCFWDHPPIKCGDDCVSPRTMLNLKTANLVNLTWANPPAPDPTAADPEYDIGKIMLDLGDHVIGTPTPVFDFRVPLRSIGGSFSIGSDTYGRPPALSGQTLYLYVTMHLNAGFGWFDYVNTTYATVGYLNSTMEIIDGGGSIIQTLPWCNMHSKTGTQYDTNNAGAFQTGQGGGALGSFTIYEYVRAYAPVTFPAADFDDGELHFSLVSSATSSTGAAGAPLAGTNKTGFIEGQTAVKLIALSSPSVNADWDF